MLQWSSWRWACHSPRGCVTMHINFWAADSHDSSPWFLGWLFRNPRQHSMLFWKHPLHVASLVAQRLKCLPAMWETQVRSLGREDTPEKEMATHSSILAWRNPWREEPGRLQSTGLQRVGHDWATSLHYIAGGAWFYQWLSCITLPIFLQKSSIDWTNLVHHGVLGAFTGACYSGKILLSVMWCWCIYTYIYLYRYKYIYIYRKREREWGQEKSFLFFTLTQHLGH